jgi:hypothetical protein
MATRNIVPRANGEGSIGTAAKHWGAGHFDNIVGVTDSIMLIGKFVGNSTNDKLSYVLNNLEQGNVYGKYLVADEKITIDNTRDIRQIKLIGFVIDLQIDGWLTFINNNTSCYCPEFIDCTFIGNGNRIYDDAMIVGAKFTNCYFQNASIAQNTEGKYIQSLYVVNSQIRGNVKFIKASNAYNFVFSQNRVESSADTLIYISREASTGSLSISQCSINNNLIEGFSSSVPIVLGSCAALSISNNYFEANRQGSIKFRHGEGDSYTYNFSIKNNYFLEGSGVTSIDYTYGVYGGAVEISDNFFNSDYLCSAYPTYNNPLALANNKNTGSGKLFQGDGYAVELGKSSNVEWKNDHWEITYTINKQFYSGAFPLLLVAAGSYGSSDQYQGYAIAHILPCTMYSNGVISNVYVNPVISKNINNNSAQAGNVTITASLSSTNPNNTKTVITVNVSGFTKARFEAKLIPLLRINAYVDTYNN